MVADAKYSNPVTAEQLALAALRADAEKRRADAAAERSAAAKFLADAQSDADESGADEVGADPNGGAEGADEGGRGGAGQEGRRAVRRAVQQHEGGACANGTTR